MTIPIPDDELAARAMYNLAEVLTTHGTAVHLEAIAAACDSAAAGAPGEQASTRWTWLGQQIRDLAFITEIAERESGHTLCDAADAWLDTDDDPKEKP